jgi:hypothetical protein
MCEILSYIMCSYYLHLIFPYRFPFKGNLSDIIFEKVSLVLLKLYGSRFSDLNETTETASVVTYSWKFFIQISNSLKIVLLRPWKLNITTILEPYLSKGCSWWIKEGVHGQTLDRQTLDRQTLDRQTLDRQTLDTTNPGHDKPWTRQTPDTTNPGHNRS